MSESDRYDTEMSEDGEVMIRHYSNSQDQDMDIMKLAKEGWDVQQKMRNPKPIKWNLLKVAVFPLIAAHEAMKVHKHYHVVYKRRKS